MITIKRPLLFADFETTGADTEKDRIVEYSFCKLFPNGDREIKTGRLNPEMPINPDATKVHGITDEDVKDKPMFKQLAKGILTFMEGCDLAGFRSNTFDFPLLFNEFLRAGITWEWKNHLMIDVGVIFTVKEPRTLAAAHKFYCKEELEGAHNAEIDILATTNVFQAMLTHYSDLPETLEELALLSNYGKPRLDMAGKFTLDEDGTTIIFNFGKNKGQPCIKDYDYLRWMAFNSNAKFNEDTRQFAISLIKEIPST